MAVFPCRSCGRPVLVPQIFGPGTVAFMTGVTIQCPHCGFGNPIPNGVYSFMDDVVAALRGVSAPDLARFRIVAEMMTEKAITPEKAVEEATAIRPELGRVLQKALAWGIPSIVGPAVAAWLAWEAMKSGDKSGAALLQAVQQQTAVAEQTLEVNRAIKADLARLIEMQGTSPPPTRPIPKPSTSPRCNSVDERSARPERRRAERTARKAAKRKP